MSRTVAVPKNIHMEPVPGGLRIDLPVEAAGGGKRRRRAGGAALHGNDEVPVCTVVLPAFSPGGIESRELLRRLESSPLMLAGLLEEGAGALDAHLPAQPPWRQPRAAADACPACSCGAPGCGHAERAMAYGDAAWAADDGLRLALLGWTPETLAAAVLDRWAALQPLPDPEEALRQAAGGPEAASRGGAGDGPNIAEWLAEMAGQGRLHQPGPQFHDVKAALRELGPPAAAGDPPAGRPRAVEPASASREPGPDSAPWAALLPGVSGAARGLSLVAGRVMERAAELAAAQQNKPR